MTWALVCEHLFIVLASCILSIAAGLPLGIFAYTCPKARAVILRAVDLLQTIPSLALLGIIMVFLGAGKATVITGITLYSLLPIGRNTCLGLQEVDPGVKEAARGMGSTRAQMLLRVKLPMAAGVILAGLRNTVVMTISVAGIASFVGAGGLGVAIYRGITIYNPAMTAAGSVLIALLAFLCDLALGALERHFKKRGSP